MSDLSENKIIQEGGDKYEPEIEATNYFKEQDEKFVELNIKLQKLKEENKKQIDAIIKNLDDLMASKCVIEQALDKVPIDDIPIKITNEKLNVVELLSKVTGIVSDSNVCSSKADQHKEYESKDDIAAQVIKEENKSETSDKMELIENVTKESDDPKETMDNPVVKAED